MENENSKIVAINKQLPTPLEVNNGKLPPSWINICLTLSKLNPYVAKEIISSCVIVKIAQMITSKRITVNESGKIILPNFFVLNFLESGGGKDKLVGDLDEYVFPDFIDWFKENVVTTDKDGNKKDIDVPMELEDGTQAGIYLLASVLDEIGLGSILIKMPEFGMYLKNANKNNLKFLADLCKFYDGKIPRTFTKSSGFTKEINNLPVNMLAHTEFTILFDLYKTLKSLFMSGLGRRIILGYQPQRKWVCTTFSDEEETKIRNELITYGKELFNIFERIPAKSSYKLLPEAKATFNEYKEKIEELYNQTKNALLQLEIRDRIYKVIKLSCLIACFNHPTETIINTVDMEQAINSIDELSSGLEQFLKVNPVCDDRDFKAFKFLENNIDKGYSRTALINELCKNCGYTRRGLNAYFDSANNNFITNIRGIASDYGYDFIEDTEKYPHGTYYYLHKISENPATPHIVQTGTENP